MKAWHLLVSLAVHAVVIGAAAVLCLSFSKPDEIVIPISVELVEPSPEPPPAPAEQPAQQEPEHVSEAPETQDHPEPPEPQEPLEHLESLEPLAPPELLERPEPPEPLPPPEHQEKTEEVAETATASPVEQAKVVSDPVALNKIVPVYPRLARRKGHEGSVVVDVSISQDGSVSEANVFSSSGHKELDAAAIDAVRNAKFSPATENGASVDGRLRLTLDFRLEN